MILFAQGIWWVVVGRGFFQKGGLRWLPKGAVVGRRRAAARRWTRGGGAASASSVSLGVSAWGRRGRELNLFPKNSDGRGVGGRRSVGRVLRGISKLSELGGLSL